MEVFAVLLLFAACAAFLILGENEPPHKRLPEHLIDPEMAARRKRRHTPRKVKLKTKNTYKKRGWRDN